MFALFRRLVHDFFATKPERVSLNGQPITTHLSVVNLHSRWGTHVLEYKYMKSNKVYRVNLYPSIFDDCDGGMQIIGDKVGESVLHHGEVEELQTLARLDDR